MSTKRERQLTAFTIQQYSPHGEGQFHKVNLKVRMYCMAGKNKLLLFNSNL